MEKITIRGNGHAIPIIYGTELSEKERRQFDYYDPEELDSAMFFRYKGDLYDIGNFMNIHNKIHYPNPPEWIKEFDGIMSDGFFSGILIKLGTPEDPYADCIRVYTYY